jgi:tRNA threonylcarbamoyladenosine biosynthesis protein TsaE
LHSYESGRLPLHHIDFYRLETDEQILAAGLEEYLRPSGITVVEWWDRWRAKPPPIFCRIDFEVLSDTDRRITYDGACP